MAIQMWFVFVGWGVLTLISLVWGVNPHRRFEYKMSFKGPHLVQRDGTIPFWEHGGHAIASEDSVRITPSLRSKKGWVWAKEQNVHANWEVEVTFRISGRGRIGADGLAIWYTEARGIDGPVFGGADAWKGLGLFFDSFDNDGQHNNPYILAMVNDGTMYFDHNTDGANQQLGGCLRDFRNKPFAIKARIEYFNKALSVFFHNGMTQNKDDYELCLRAENVNLPDQGYFGVSAATGGLADDQDVHSFITHSLRGPTDQQQVPPSVSEDDRKKFEQEFDEYWQKLQKAKDEYVKEHPDKRPPIDGEDDKWFESQDSRELKMIFDAQNAIHNTIRELHRKLDEVIGRQERTLSQISLLPQGGGAAQPQGTGQAQLPYVDTIKRHEVDAVLNNQREMAQNIRDIRSLTDAVHSLSTGISSNTAGGTNQFEATQQQQQLKDQINNLHNDVRTLANRQPGTGTPCPPPPANSCITPFYMFVFLGAQITVFIVYSIYKSSKEASAKKFY